MTRRLVIAVVATLCCTSLAPRAGRAQHVPLGAWEGAPEALAGNAWRLPSWASAWSPLRPISDAPATLLHAPAPMQLALLPRPVVDAFFFAGAPGALARSEAPSFGLLGAQRATADGALARPFDAQQSGITQVHAGGWRRVGARGMAAGRVLYDQETQDIAGLTQRTAPYGPNPFVYGDSVTPPMQRTRARLEGALAWRAGPLGVGGAFGLDLRESRTVDFPLRRTGRTADPAVALGAEVALPWMDTRIGGTWRWQALRETMTLDSRPLVTRLFPVQGFTEPENLTASLPIGHRVERNASVVGVHAQTTVAGTRVVVHHEAAPRREDQFGTGGTPGNEPRERWRADGTTTRAAAQRAFAGGRVLATAAARWWTVDGDASRPDLTGTSYRSSESGGAYEADVRWLGAAWRGGVAGGVSSREVTRRDFVAERVFTLTQPTPFVSGELARRVRGGWVSVGASLARRSPDAQLPAAPEPLGPNYPRVIAPAIAYDAAALRATAVWAGVEWPVRDAGRVSVQLLVEDAQALTEVQPEGLAPGGRSGWRLAVGWVR